MGKESKIQWTDVTWNIARGCTKVDQDCRFCYMYRGSFDGSRYNPMDVVKTKTVFNLPLKVKEPSKIFASSLTDWFHPAIDDYRHEAYAIMRQRPDHIYQVLSKRINRANDHLPEDWGEGWENVWLGTSVGGNEGRYRIDDLVNTPAKIRFVSFEPLWEKINLDFDEDVLSKLHWAVIGGESGNETGKYRYRPCKVEWIEEMVEYFQYHGISVFVKQLGTHLSKQMGLKDRHGGDISEFPPHLQIRQFPDVKPVTT